MARKSKTSPFEDVVELVAMLPWWAGVAIGALALRGPASLCGRRRCRRSRVAPAGFHSVRHDHAQGTGGCRTVPAAHRLPRRRQGLSAWRRRERSALVTDVAQSEAANALDAMSWREFETLVGEAFRLQGYRVAETGGGGADGGVDLVLERDGETTLVQCKQWKAFKVGVETVRELYGVMAARGAAAGFVVSSGRFTDEAQRFASGRNVPADRRTGAAQADPPGTGQARPPAHALWTRRHADEHAARCCGR